MSRIDDQDGRNAMLRAGRYAIALTQISELVGLDTKDPNWDPVDSVEAVRDFVELRAKLGEPQPSWKLALAILVITWVLAHGCFV